MKNFPFILVALIVLAVLARDAMALTRPEIITRAREFTAINWSIADTAAALHDSPSHRYWETGECGRHSPLTEWIQNYQGEAWDGLYSGACYAYGGRQTPGQATSWVSGGVPNAIGLCSAQWYWRFNHNRNPFCFRGTTIAWVWPVMLRSGATRTPTVPRIFWLTLSAPTGTTYNCAEGPAQAPSTATKNRAEAAAG